MPIEVCVLSVNGHPPAKVMEASFDQSGGTIGRLEEERNNHLHLPDPERFISRIHARITYEKDTYYLTDTSVDGTYVRDRDTRIHEDRVRLADGDCLWIGDYKLAIRIHPAEMPAAAPGDSLGDFDIQTIGTQDAQPTSEADHQWWSDTTGIQAEDTGTSSGAVNQGNNLPLDEAFRPPEIENAAGPPHQIPPDFNVEELIHGLDGSPAQKETPPHAASVDNDPFAIQSEPQTGSHHPIANDHQSPETEWFSENDVEKRPDEVPVQPPVHTPAAGPPIRHQDHGDLFHTFLKAAGVKNPSLYQESDIPRMMETLGVVFREMVTGLVTLLKGRSEQKIQLRMTATQIMPAENNPLKFFHDIDETVEQLLAGDKPGFVDTRTAVREGYAEIMNHHLAMTAGIQAAVIHLIEQFDPQRFSEQHKGGGIFSKKAKLWNAYQKAYADIADTALDDFFGEALSRAYQAQLSRLQGKTDDLNGTEKE